jgi:ABC-type phosphate transport system substrate-binding protein
VALPAAAAPLARASVVRPAKVPTSQLLGKRPYIVRGRRPHVNAASLLVLGGGSTFAAIAFSGASAANGTQPAVTQGAGSILGYFDATAALPSGAPAGVTAWTTSYCQTGSGFGKAVLDGNVTEPNPCPALNVTPIPGFAFDSPGETDTADFAASDAPVVQTEYSTLTPVYPKRGEFVQVPFLAGSVALAYDNTDVTGTLRLTIPEICQIADGEITDWQGIPHAADSAWVDPTHGDVPSPVAPVGPKNPGFPERPLAFVYRSDPSGSTFAFTNFLSAAVTVSSRLHCTGAGETWGLNQNFVQALPTPATQNTSAFVGVAGDANVISYINASDGAIGYTSGAGVLAAAPSNVRSAQIYTVAVNNPLFLKDPIVDLPTAASLVNTFKKDYVVNPTCGNSGTAGAISGTGCTGSSPLGRPIPDVVAATGVYKAGCLGVVDPSAYQAPGLGYPIVAVTNLEFYSSRNGIYSPGLGYLADELSAPATAYGPPGTANAITTVDKEGTKVGLTGYSSLAIPDVLLSSTSIGLIPLCIE